MGNICNNRCSNKIEPVDFDLNTASINNNECPICLELILNDNFRTLTCRCAPKVRFHRKCINMWLAHNQICPICRYEVEINIIRNLKIKDYPTELFKESIGLIFEALLQNIEEEDILLIMQENLDPDIIKNTILVIKNYLKSPKYQSDIENENISFQINYSDIV